MKKISCFFIMNFVLIGMACADMNIGGGFVGPNVAGGNMITVSQISNLRDDTNVMMQGRIINSLGDEKYTFMDDTGTITVEIDDDDWNGITITPETTVQIYGEVDRGLFKKTKIEVDSINVNF